ncbi:MAG: hypothetical protein FJY82_02270 [Candidatus Aminicenantes bacterium]|nr:hypothetical protein [Candidatus Aminicenantes bacterium]
MRLHSTALFAVIVLATLAAACERTPRIDQTTTAVTPLDNATSASVRIRPGAGEVVVRGGEIGDLMKGTFRFNRRHFEPRVDVLKVGDRARLVIERRRSRTIFLGPIRSTWDIQLTNRVPLDLDFDLGAGEAELDLRGLNLRSLAVDMGVGKLTLDLTGTREGRLEASIDGGIGEATVYLPTEVGVRVRVDGGLGSIRADGFVKTGKVFTNPAGEKSGSVAIDLEIDGGIGSVSLRLRDSRSASF